MCGGRGDKKDLKEGYEATGDETGRLQSGGSSTPTSPTRTSSAPATSKLPRRQSGCGRCCPSFQYCLGTRGGQRSERCPCWSRRCFEVTARWALSTLAGGSGLIATARF